mmetsp:Transcript_21492/g.49156  ORF Transcript_21492/g.49156 Transcript_21492/m.49156 type:complete len:283 (+) Transcript_21492:78-926(+)
MFSTSQAFGTQAPMGAQEVTPKKARSEDKQTCLPTTIRAIETAISESTEGGSIRFYGTEQSMLILVGVVENLVKQAASMEFSLNDATGRIKARFYMSDRQAAALDRLAVGSHVSVFGNVRTAPVTHLAVTGMRLVESADEISFHMIEAALAAVKLQKAQGGVMMPLKKPALAAEAVTTEPSRSAVEFSTPKKAPAARMPMPELEPAPQPKPAQARLEGKALRSAVIAFLQKEGESRPEGVSLSDVCEQFKPASADDVGKTLEQLVGDGDVFTTIDDDHFQCV